MLSMFALRKLSFLQRKLQKSLRLHVQASAQFCSSIWVNLTPLQPLAQRAETITTSNKSIYSHEASSMSLSMIAALHQCLTGARPREWHEKGKEGSYRIT